MFTLDRLIAVAGCVTLTACAYLPPRWARVYAPQGRTQELLIRTDPAGASCSLQQRGTIVASVEATPEIAIVPRTDAPLDVACRKAAYLDARMTFAVLHLKERLEVLEASPTMGAKYERTVGDFAEYMGVNMTGAFLPPVGLAWGWSLDKQEKEQNPPFAYRALPEFILTPEAFDSETARDAFFLALKAKLETAAEGQLTRINQECRFWPCKPSDVACPDPVCEHQRAVVNSQLQTQLEQIPVLRAQVRVVAR
jgi:hypothetical protein